MPSDAVGCRDVKRMAGSLGRHGAGYLRHKPCRGAEPIRPHPQRTGKRLPSGYLPSKLMIRVGGGIFPPNYSVVLQGESLIYHVSDIDPKTNEVRETSKVVTPSASQWRQFWKAMEEIDLWRWQPEYADPRIADGTKWGVDIEFAGRTSVRSAVPCIRAPQPGAKSPPTPNRTRTTRASSPITSKRSRNSWAASAPLAPAQGLCSSDSLKAPPVRAGFEAPLIRPQGVSLSRVAGECFDSMHRQAPFVTTVELLQAVPQPRASSPANLQTCVPAGVIPSAPAVLPERRRESSHSVELLRSDRADSHRIGVAKFGTKRAGLTLSWRREQIDNQGVEHQIGLL